MENTTKKKKKKIKKLYIWAGIIGLLLLCIIPLYFTNPSEADFKKAIPKEYVEIVAKKESVVYKDFKIMSSFITTKQVSSNKAERVMLFGVAGHIIKSDTGIMKFFSNALTWIGPLLEGAKITILLTVASVVTGIFLSVFLALGKMSKIKPVKWFCNAYIFFFRGTPLLMQLFFVWFGLPVLFPALTISNRFLAAWIAFGLNSGAYCAEIIRAAIQSIDHGQFEAAKALGFSYGKTMRKIIIPQTFKRLVPPLANEFIMVLKDASLTSIIALKDLSKITQSIMTSSGEVSVFLLSMGIYLLITAAFTKMFNYFEKKAGVYE